MGKTLYYSLYCYIIFTIVTILFSYYTQVTQSSISEKEITISESGATTILDGDKGNGAFKKSYGIIQVKLGTVYYVKNKRPDLIKLYAPEVNVLPKEDITT